MDKPLLAYHAWLALPQETRAKLVRLFDIPRTGESVVQVGVSPDGTIGGTQKQDGHSPTDLYAITVEKMQNALNNPDENDFYILFNGVIENIDEILGIVPDPITPEDVVHVQTPLSADESAYTPRDPEELVGKEQEPEDITPKPEEHAKAKKGRPAKTK